MAQSTARPGPAATSRRRTAGSARIAAGQAASPRPVLVAVAHGSRDPRALATVTALLDRVRARRPSLDVRLAHIEIDEPLLGPVLARIAGRRVAAGGPAGPDARPEARPDPVLDAVLVPLLFGRGHHVTVDLPRAVAGAPHLRAAVAPPLGPDALLAEALYARLVEAGWAPGREVGGEAVVLAAAGSRDPRSAADTARMASLLSARLGGVPVVPAYASAAAPTVPEAVAALRARGLGRIAVASYFAAPGRFAAQCAEAAPWIAAEPLGAHEAMARLVLRRYDRVAAESP